jgi:hypothetical protein
LDRKLLFVTRQQHYKGSGKVNKITHKIAHKIVTHRLAVSICCMPSPLSFLVLLGHVDVQASEIQASDIQASDDQADLNVQMSKSHSGQWR